MVLSVAFHCLEPKFSKKDNGRIGLWVPRFEFHPSGDPRGPRTLGHTSVVSTVRLFEMDGTTGGTVPSIPLHGSSYSLAIILK